MKKYEMEAAKHILVFESARHRYVSGSLTDYNTWLLSWSLPK